MDSLSGQSTTVKIRMATHYSSVTKPDKLRPNDVYIMDIIPDDWVLDKLQGEPDAPIIIKPLPNRIRTINTLRVSDTCSYLQLDGLGHLCITGVKDDNKPLVEVWGSHIEARSLTIDTQPNAHLAWTSEDWETYARRGFVAHGQQVSLTDSRITNTSFAIELYGKHCETNRNTILHFCSDGIRGLNSFQTITDNLIAHAHIGNPKNHLDHIQLWNHAAPTPQQGALVGMKVGYNVCYNLPSNAKCQGIGCYDGAIVASVFEGNIVYTNHPHLLTLASAQDCKLHYNQLCRSELPDEQGNEKGWIMLGTNKPDHPACSNHKITNNYAPRVIMPEGAGEACDNQEADQYLLWYLANRRAALAQESFA